MSAAHARPGGVRVCNQRDASGARRFRICRSTMLLSAERLLELYELMLLTRTLDDRQAILGRQGRQGIHLSARGHEASGAGSALALDPARDILVPSHRSLAAVLAFGVTPEDVLLQCLSRASDPASGGRSMPNHYAHPARRVLSMSSPIATQLP